MTELDARYAYTISRLSATSAAGPGGTGFSSPTITPQPVASSSSGSTVWAVRLPDVILRQIEKLRPGDVAFELQMDEGPAKGQGVSGKASNVSHRCPCVCLVLVIPQFPLQLIDVWSFSLRPPSRLIAQMLVMDSQSYPFVLSASASATSTQVIECVARPDPSRYELELVACAESRVLIRVGVATSVKENIKETSEKAELEQHSKRYEDAPPVDEFSSDFLPILFLRPASLPILPTPVLAVLLIFFESLFLPDAFTYLLFILTAESLLWRGHVGVCQPCFVLASLRGRQRRNGF
jgi:hypothetical protein